MRKRKEITVDDLGPNWGKGPQPDVEGMFSYCEGATLKSAGFKEFWQAPNGKLYSRQAALNIARSMKVRKSGE